MHLWDISEEVGRIIFVGKRIRRSEPYPELFNAFSIVCSFLQSASYPLLSSQLHPLLLRLPLLFLVLRMLHIILLHGFQYFQYRTESQLIICLAVVVYLEC